MDQPRQVLVIKIMRKDLQNAREKRNNYRHPDDNKIRITDDRENDDKYDSNDSNNSNDSDGTKSNESNSENSSDERGKEK